MSNVAPLYSSLTKNWKVYLEGWSTTVILHPRRVPAVQQDTATQGHGFYIVRFPGCRYRRKSRKKFDTLLWYLQALL